MSKGEEGGQGIQRGTKKKSDCRFEARRFCTVSVDHIQCLLILIGRERAFFVFFSGVFFSFSTACSGAVQQMAKTGEVVGPPILGFPDTISKVCLCVCGEGVRKEG